jgi:hypothetical protein
MRVNRIDIAKVERRKGLRIGLGALHQLAIRAKIPGENLVDGSLGDESLSDVDDPGPAGNVHL